MILDELYFNRLSLFLNRHIVTSNNKIIVSDGSDILYELNETDGQFYLIILEKGKETFRETFLTERLALFYFPIFVKRALTSIPLNNMKRIDSAKNITEIKSIMIKEGLEEFFSINRLVDGKINFVENLPEPLVYQGNNGLVYPIPHLKSRVVQNLYSSTVRYKAMKEWLNNFKNLFEETISNEEEAILLGYKTPFVE